MKVQSGHIESVEGGNEVATAVADSPTARVHWPKAIVALLAVNMIAYAQIVSIIGSGLLATQATAYLGGTSNAGWLSTILTIFTLALNPIVSQAADYWGRKSFIIVSSLVGGVAGPIIISRTLNVTTLISGLCVLGLAFGSQALTFTVASEVIPRRFRAVGQATLNETSALGGISATLAGSALIAHSENYRIFWYIVAGLYLLGALGVACC
ncbi:major facilitator superfamily domain-containing protein [Aspergillus germanicus]